MVLLELVREAQLIKLKDLEPIFESLGAEARVDHDMSNAKRHSLVLPVLDPIGSREEHIGQESHNLGTALLSLFAGQLLHIHSQVAVPMVNGLVNFSDLSSDAMLVPQHNLGGLFEHRLDGGPAPDG